MAATAGDTAASSFVLTLMNPCNIVGARRPPSCPELEEDAVPDWIVTLSDKETQVGDDLFYRTDIPQTYNGKPVTVTLVPDNQIAEDFLHFDTDTSTVYVLATEISNDVAGDYLVSIVVEYTNNDDAQVI